MSAGRVVYAAGGTRPRAAQGDYPFRNHRTVAQVDEDATRCSLCRTLIRGACSFSDCPRRDAA